MFLYWPLWALGGGLVLATIGFFVWRSLRARLREARLIDARREFHRQRERLEAKFFQLAAASGKPRGLEWTNCDFENDVVYVRDRRSGDLLAFVGVTISFAAIEGGGMEEVEAVSNLRAATAVFQMNKKWGTEGRAIFNLSPVESAERFHDDVEVIEHEVAGSRS